MARTKSKLWRWWGYGVAAAIVLLAINNAAGPVTYLVLIGVLILYILFQAPAVRGAINRQYKSGKVDFCRNNSNGMLVACWVRQHKMQKLGKQWWSLSRRQKSEGIWANAPAKLATFTGLVGTITGVFAMVHDLV